MFLKPNRRRKNGKLHEYWTLVESYRTRGGPRHRVVAYLGELSAGEQKGWARLGATLDGRAASQVRQLSLFEPCQEEDEPVPEQIEVKLAGVRVVRTRDFGDVYLALSLWRILELDKFFEKHLPKGREEVSWGLMACVLSVARLLAPSSELHIEEKWFPKTALSELLGVTAEKVNDTRLYRTLDKVLPLKPQLEAHLKERIGELFEPDFEILLYDITSTYFEGLAERNPQAQWGYSRDHRPDCKQVCVAVVVTREGFPLGYEVFDGNRRDVTTVEQMVEQIEEKYGRASRIWVMDRGMVSEDNLEFLRERGSQYLVGTPRSELKRFEHELLEQDWSEVVEGVEVKLITGPDGEETFVLCRSEDRKAKERAIHQRFVQRIGAELKRLEELLETTNRRRDRGKLERQLGRLLQRNSRGAGAFAIHVMEEPRHRSGLRLEWERVKEWEEWADLSEGCYLLRTNIQELTSGTLWKIYIQLTDVEESIRTYKTDLNIRPIWHQLEERVQAHILFSFIAYALWKTLQTWMDRSGLGRGARTVLEAFSQLKANDIRLPTTNDREVQLCCITCPDKSQKAIIDRLGIEIPQRLGRPSWVPAKTTSTEM